MPHRLFLLAAAPLFSGTLAAGTAEEEVEYLINQVAESGCTYTRNGSEHPSTDAADHLRLKYRRGKKYVNSAEQFIDRLATESSWSGKPYTMTCEGTVSSSAAWLHQALREHRQSP